MPDYFLYADDDTEDAGMLVQMAGEYRRPFRVRCVANGFDVIRHLQAVAARASYPSLIILDFRMARLNGIETLALLREDDLYRLIPVVMLTGGISIPDAARCRLLGADVLKKPATGPEWDALLGRLAGYLDD